MRTPSIASLQDKVSKLEGQVSKLEAKKTELATTRALLSSMNSPESIKAARVRLEEDRAELAKLEAFINGQEEAGGTDTVTIAVTEEEDIVEIDASDLDPAESD